MVINRGPESPDRAASDGAPDPGSPPAAPPATSAGAPAAADQAHAIFRKPAPPREAPREAPAQPAELPIEEIEAPSRGVRPIDALLVAAGVAIVVIVGYGYFKPSASPGPVLRGAPVVVTPTNAGSAGGQATAVGTPAAPSRPAGFQSEEVPPQLSLVGMRCRREDGSHVIEGAVRNVTTAPLPQVFVVGLWKTADGAMVTTDDAPVKDDPIPPQQTSAFRVSVPEHADVSICQVAFRTFGGGPIAWADARRQ